MGGERGDEWPEEPEECDWGLREGCFGLVEDLHREREREREREEREEGHINQKCNAIVLNRYNNYVCLLVIDID